ncbi:hypothetical protein [Polyangium mundeleinium]|uniref:Uncharacterized protein n=1 Tax=Polyangium mundeleinium TaxID=2995306 RepID=A0ABT5EUV2_9BACT|nr:hypothetical protein [Polyangium mundeleinium]MDC0745566.1 hypothetical protein [Polyangium mundeleinium]
MSRKSMVAFFPFMLVAVVPVIGCVGAPGDEEVESTEVVGEATFGINILNALVPEALTAGGDFAKARLSVDAMVPGARAAITSPSERGRLARMFLRYAVGCALGPGQVFSFSWTDLHGVGHNESYRGIAGLAPSWEQAPLDEVGQQWVSACLGARTNRYGRAVEISMQGSADALAEPADEEIHEFTYEEGAFWGNLFVPEPYLRTCYNPANVGRARRTSRDCAAGLPGKGDEDCGIMEIMGPCAEQCEPLGEGLYHPGCAAPESGVPSAVKTEYVITVFLP